tara:strand:+ start:123 stop:236 length:114 start_codon:yes stop_codon:yes gene_type:complete
MKIKIDNISYVVNLTEEELFKFFEVNSIDVSLAEEKA